MGMGMEMPMVDIGPVPVNYVDQIMSVDIVGPNLRIVLGEKRRLDGRLVCVPVLEIVRPLISDIPVVFEQMLAAALLTGNSSEPLPLH